MLPYAWTLLTPSCDIFFFSEKQVLLNVYELFVAGTESTTTAICWGLLYLLHNSECQDKMYQECSAVVGHNRVPCTDDKPKLPYCNAAMAEILRIGNSGPLALPHAASRDTVFKGYNISEGTVIIPVLDSIAFDENIFINPKQFDPSRFLDDDGHFKSSDKTTPFSLGKHRNSVLSKFLISKLRN